MKNQFLLSRRRMLSLGCRAVSTVGAASAFGHLGRVSALAQAGGGYKALVCVFQFGGNDANNTVVPLSATGYADYQRVRQSLALAPAALVPVTSASNEAYGLHPSLAPLAPLYTTNRDLAILLNLGTLVKPLTKTEYRQANTTTVPRNLFSHSDQQQQWQNATPVPGPTSASGWSGRIADRILYLNTSPFPPAVAVSGSALQLVGQQTKPTTVSADNFGIDGSGDSPAAQARDQALQQLLSFSSGATLVQAANRILGDAISVVKQLEQAANSAQDFTGRFPQTGLGQQLAQVARIISIRGLLGMNRQIFFVSQGGYDTHANQLGTHAGLLSELANAMATFYQVMGELGLGDAVTTFTESEFNRTFQPNGTAGTDHAWGGHSFVLGGAVKGNVYGVMPTLALNGPDDSGNRGNWIPTLALDQYGATLAKWFGVPDVDLPQVFPNIGNFPVKDLGFL